MQRYGIIKTDWSPVPVSQKDNKQQFEVSTGAYRLKIDKKTGAISVSDRKGRVIIEKVIFLTSADPLCTDLGEVINAKYKDMKVPNNGTIIGDDKNPGSMKDQAETGSLICRELLGLDKPEGSPVASPRTETYYKKRPCVEMVGLAADLLEQYLAEHPVPRREANA